MILEGCIETTPLHSQRELILLDGVWSALELSDNGFMQMKKKLVLSLLCLVIVSCASRQVTVTTMATITPSPLATSTLNPTTTPLPASIVEGAHRSGMSPEEIVSFYLEIRSYMENKDVNALTNKIYFPLNECGRNKGDNIETKNEFVQRFNEIFTSEIIFNYVNANLEDARLDMYGVYIGGIWFGSICTDKTCNTAETWILGVKRYCSFRITAPMEDTQWATEEARPDYSGRDFVYGTYKMESYKDEGGLITEEELKDRMGNIDVRIEKDNYSTDSDCNFGCSCPSPEYEFNKPFYRRYGALWFGIPVVGELIMICDGDPQVHFDVLANDKLGYYYFGYYITLAHQ